MPPHMIFGYSLGEWVSLLTILGIISSFFVYLVKQIIVNPLREDIKTLSKTIDNFDTALKQYDKRIDKLERDSVRYDTNFTTLFKWKNKEERIND